ncbi:hypothetical protein [Oceanobacter antarcticus]|uniref:Uncharacterized protein n=1 Tax=Oceanobacter antarcticus TaxID=3133425 RepID=A0ABW8NK80_9GAMM
MLFFPIQQELDCISNDGRIIGRIKYNGATRNHVFQLDADIVELTDADQAKIAERLAGLDTGVYLIPMQDDD